MCPLTSSPGWNLVTFLPTASTTPGHVRTWNGMGGQWHEPVPVSVKLLPDSGTNCQLYD
jgi:hypothetical protein